MFKKLSYLKKLLLAYSTIVVSLFTVLIALYLNSEVKSMRASAQSTMEQLGYRSASQLESLLGDMSRISLGIAGNESVRATMASIRPDNSGNYFVDNPAAGRTIQRVIANMCDTRFTGKGYHVVGAGGDYVSLDIYDAAYPDLAAIRHVSWLSHLRDGALSKYVSPVGPDEYGSTPGETFSFVRAVQDPYGWYGMVDVQYSRDFLDEIFETAGLDIPSATLVLQGDALFYSTPEAPVELVFEQLSDIRLPASGQLAQEQRFAAEEYMVCASQLPAYGMKIYQLVRSADYRAHIYRTSAMILGFGLLVLALLLAAVYAVTQGLYRPIRQLRGSIDSLNYADLSVRLKVDGANDEVTQLADAFTAMLNGIRKTTDELVDARTRELKANYKVLQAQVNPHFIHNTLAVIGFMGERYNAPEIMDICAQFTRMLSYTTSLELAEVPSRNELEHTETYLKLMKYRYLDQLEYAVVCSDAISGVPIPKFVLQPTVENCFSHSFVGREPPYIVRVDGVGNAQNWRITVTDNGVGFSGEALEELGTQFEKIRREIGAGKYSYDGKIGGLGITNTYARLLLHSGGKIRMELSNLQEGGACVAFVYEENPI
jgi:sensor histidine kinase YesM